MYNFKFLLDNTQDVFQGIFVQAIVSGSTVEDYQEEPLQIKKIVKTALNEWLGKPENETRRISLDDNLDINDFSYLLDKSMVEILKKYGLHDLDICILPLTSLWTHSENLLS